MLGYIGHNVITIKEIMVSDSDLFKSDYYLARIL